MDACLFPAEKGSFSKANLMMTTSTFQSSRLVHGTLFDLSTDRFPTRVFGWSPTTPITIVPRPGQATYFGFVFEGAAHLIAHHNSYRLVTGQYFSVNEPIHVSEGQGIIIESEHTRGMNTIGGPLEETGRLRYINGCTDSLLIAPVLYGDPCLNALFFPPDIEQTQHSHPSLRIGIVVRGSGECLTPEGSCELSPGLVFVIPEVCLHRFRSNSSGPLAIVAYHPDSDFGPSHEDHPMINRTIVEGVSAATLKAFRSKSPASRHGA